MQELNEGLVPFEFKVPCGWLAAVDIDKFIDFVLLARRVNETGKWKGKLHGGVVVYTGTTDRETLAELGLTVERAWAEWSEMVADNPQIKRDWNEAELHLEADEKCRVPDHWS